MIPKSIPTPKKNLDDLISIIKWTQSMPDCLNVYMDDQFSEDTWAAMRDHVPIDLEDWEFINGIRMDDGVVFVLIGEDGKEGDHLVPMVEASK